MVLDHHEIGWIGEQTSPDVIPVDTIYPGVDGVDLDLYVPVSRLGAVYLSPEIGVFGHTGEEAISELCFDVLQVVVPYNRVQLRSGGESEDKRPSADPQQDLLRCQIH